MGLNQQFKNMYEAIEIKPSSFGIIPEKDGLILFENILKEYPHVVDLVIRSKQKFDFGHYVCLHIKPYQQSSSTY